MAADSRVGAVVEEKHQEMARSFHGRLRDCCECSDPFEAEAHIACSACVALALAFAEQEREVTEANAMLIDRYAATYKDPLLESVTRGAANFIRLQRATPGGEREEGSGR
jgi:xylose isomerase